MDLLSNQHHMVKLLQTAFLMAVYSGLSSFERSRDPGLLALLQIIFDLQFLESIVASCNEASKSDQDRATTSIQHHLKDFTELVRVCLSAALFTHDEIFRQNRGILDNFKGFKRM
jgi:hypothetical protein